MDDRYENISEETNAAETTVVTTTDSLWQCSCGTTNEENFCYQCGNPKPNVQNEWVKPEQQNANSDIIDNDGPSIGRASRSDFLGKIITYTFGLLLLNIILFGGGLASGLKVIHNNPHATVSAVLSSMGLNLSFLFIGSIFLTVILLGVVVARLHDLGHSGAWAILSFVPPIDFFLFIYLALCPGSPYKNKYGDPIEESTLEFVMKTIIRLILSGIVFVGSLYVGYLFR